MQRRLDGVTPSRPDSRDFHVSAFLPAKLDRPESCSLDVPTPVYDQGVTSMCVDFSLALLKEIQEYYERGIYTKMGHGFLYGNRLGDYTGEGLIPRDAVAALQKFGLPKASDFDVMGTYTDCNTAYRERKDALDGLAIPQRVRSYARANTFDDVMGSLFTLKSPVALTIAVTDSFMWRTSNLVQDEDPSHFKEGSEYLRGYHEMVIRGAFANGGNPLYLVQNSWGTGWGDNGTCMVPANWPGIVEMWTITDMHPKGKTFYLTNGDRLMKIVEVGDDGIETTRYRTLLEPAQIVNGRFVVPARDIAEETNAYASWDEATKTGKFQWFR